MSLRGEGAVCLGVYHSVVRGHISGCWMCVTRVRGDSVCGCVSLRGEETVYLGVTRMRGPCLGVYHSGVRGPCVCVSLG